MPVTPLRPSDPTRVGPHRLLGRLGQGGMGTVFLGVSPDERAVAVKVLRDGLSDPDARRRFSHELDALRRVRGPHLVEVLDADVLADTPYLVTRFVPGQRLDDLVAAGGPLSDADLRSVARGLADALTALHAAGVVHRDLTPGNVLVVDGSPHVIDLGLATAADVTALTRSGLVIGTPGYLAPEQITGSLVTPAVDVHAWGATVALAGTGRPPYGTGRPEAVLYRIVHGDPPDLTGLPADLAPLVRAALDPAPERRPAARELLAHLGGTTRAEPVTVHLPRDVDPTTLLAADGSGATRLLTEPVRELASATSAPRATVAPPAPLPYPGDGPPVDRWDEVEPYDDEPVVPYDDDPYEPPAARPHPARSLQVAATAAAGLALAGALALVAPFVGAAAVVLVLVLLRATGSASDRLRDRRERRGERRRDPLVTALGSPWHLLVGLVDTVASLPLLALVAAAPVGVVLLAQPHVDGLEPPELVAATASVVALATGLCRRAHRRSRRLLRGGLVRATPGAASAVVVVGVVAAAAVLLLALAEGSAPVWTPLQDAPTR